MGCSTSTLPRTLIACITARPVAPSTSCPCMVRPLGPHTFSGLRRLPCARAASSAAFAIRLSSLADRAGPISRAKLTTSRRMRSRVTGRFIRSVKDILPIPAAVALLAILIFTGVASALVNFKQLDDALGPFGLSMLFVMVIGVSTIWVLRKLKILHGKRSWIASSILSFFLVAIPGIIVVPRVAMLFLPSTQAPAFSATPPPPPPPVPADKTRIQAQEVDVLATEDWHSTGIIVEKGQTVRIVASGQWSPFTPRLFDARGCIDTNLCTQDPNRDANSICCMPHGGLLGRIAHEQPFAAGLGTLFQAPIRGELQFRINDVRQGDNSGQLRVDVEIYS